MEVESESLGPEPRFTSGAHMLTECSRRGSGSLPGEAEKESQGSLGTLALGTRDGVNAVTI